MREKLDRSRSSGHRRRVTCRHAAEWWPLTAQKGSLETRIGAVGDLLCDPSVYQVGGHVLEEGAERLEKPNIRCRSIKLNVRSWKFILRFVGRCVERSPLRPFNTLTEDVE